MINSLRRPEVCPARKSLNKTMSTSTDRSAVKQDLSMYGLTNLEETHWNLEAAQLIERAVQRREGHLAANGALVVRTGQFTGRSAKDKYVVRDTLTENNVHWGAVNQPMTAEAFDRIYHRLTVFLEGQELFV